MPDVTGEIEPTAGLFVASAAWYALYAALMTIAIVIIFRSRGTRSEKLLWLAVVVAVPYLGAIALLASAMIKKRRAAKAESLQRT
ncbi:PLDc N-terminal domain-containing protein [Rathayibacter tanaceti]|uniref:Cardiolipin synthase N-terminal domain-containing protein n=2 Tax=Rathayibacter tanaceti TaxID=1671680 RepID=A0A166HI21_9MICO|nr:PLDc N-terminal domain-containing protein [Rathayibacter tanaceti]KZX20631.1 hypothetical protein ACH61_02254 [Rathayibacter tanaceti]QHC54263.1 hypothetical protein GSU10_00385 [Rathayibacter tanaceti]TCO37941.1 phospholipase D-like protein [Rathayibacter tanaceti]